MSISHKNKCIYISIPGNIGINIDSILELKDTGLHWYELKETYPIEFKTYFKFTIVKNPYFRFVMNNGNDDFIKRRFLYTEEKWKLQYPYITDENGDLVVDKIYKYEDLYQPRNDLCKKFHLRIQTPKIINLVISSHVKKIVQEYYKEDFIALNYSFEDVKVIQTEITEEEKLDRFINPKRFDLAAKLIYIKYKSNDYKTLFHDELYRDHILVFNGGWEWPSGSKNSVDDFIETFNELIHNFSTNLVNKIPVSRDNILINGAHRASIAYSRNIPLKLEYQLEKGRTYDYNFFTDRLKYGYASGTPKDKRESTLSKLDRFHSDEMAREFCRHCKDARIITLFPRVNGKHTYAEKTIKSFGDIAYAVSIKCDMNMLDNMIKEFYRGENWIGGDYSPYSIGKAQSCWNSQYPYVRVYLFVPNEEHSRDIDRCCKMLKARIRRFYNVSNHSVHINDTWEETKNLAGIFFNQNSLHFLMNSKSILNEAEQRYFNTYEALVKNSEDYCITGSFVTAVYGIRHAKDLDYIYHGKPLKTDSRKIDDHNNHPHWYGTTFDDIIHNPRNYFIHFGMKFAALHAVKEMKIKRNEFKDRLDLKYIGEYTKPVYSEIIIT